MSRVAVRRVLVLGGLDPSGGAGVTADARALERHDALCLPVVTALTVQNRRGLTALEPVAPAALSAALQAAVEDGPLDAVKVGLLGSVAQVDLVAEALRALPRGLPVVIDPVLSATAGGYAAAPTLAAAYRRALVPMATVFTPNLPEARAVFAGDPCAVALAAGCGAVLQKGGHGDGADDRLVDTLFVDGDVVRFEHRRLPTGPVHGTGCALASAIAARLAHGEPVVAACRAAIDWLQACLRAMGEGAPGGLPRPLLLQT